MKHEQLLSVVAPEVMKDSSHLEITMTSNVPSLWLNKEMNSLEKPFGNSYSYPLMTEGYAMGTYSVTMSPNIKSYYALNGASSTWTVSSLKDAIMGKDEARKFEGFLACY